MYESGKECCAVDKQGRLMSEIETLVGKMNNLEEQFERLISNISPICNNGHPVAEERDKLCEKEDISPLSREIKNVNNRLEIMFERISETINRIEL